MGWILWVRLTQVIHALVLMRRGRGIRHSWSISATRTHALLTAERQWRQCCGDGAIGWCCDEDEFDD